MPPDFEQWTANARDEIMAKEKLQDMANKQDFNEATWSALKLVLRLVE